MSLLRKFLIHCAHLLLVIFISACGGGGAKGSSVIDDDTSVGPGKNQSPTPEFCSALNFEEVSWPKDFGPLDQMAFSLAMNITGSFEGDAGWTNLSNNFDDQGVSMGILNQNLGQGSLQPLLIALRDTAPEVISNAMTPEMETSLLKMLSDWENRVAPSQLIVAQAIPERRLVVSEDLDDVDKRYAVVSDELSSRHHTGGGSNKDSVKWAKKNLYTNSAGTNFKPEWRQALKDIAGHPQYVSLQIEAARYIHDRTHTYRNRLGWTQKRSYLFLFDIVVQNGSLSEKHFEEYEEWEGAQARFTEEAQMLKMLEIRVKDSNPKWQEDVRRRKTAVIKGSGFVHGEFRNLPTEYCYDPLYIY